MRIQTLLISLLFPVSLLAQNTGINKTNPAHPLDVGGNVNIDGRLLINGTNGKAGEVLTTDGAGNTLWTGLSEFKNVTSFFASGIFTIPQGVTKIGIEAWGGGGGGAAGGGGSAGMYLVSLQTVVPGASIAITIGNGGSRASAVGQNGSHGEATFVNVNGSNLQALGGNSASNTGAGPGSASLGSNGNFIQVPGLGGTPTTFSYQQKNSTTFAVVRKYGDGGAAAPFFDRRSIGMTAAYNENTNALIENNFGTWAPIPGGGGAGGVVVNGIGLAQNGARGAVVIRY